MFFSSTSPGLLNFIRCRPLLNVSILKWVFFGDNVLEISDLWQVSFSLAQRWAKSRDNCRGTSIFFSNLNNITENQWVLSVINQDCNLEFQPYKEHARGKYFLYLIFRTLIIPMFCGNVLDERIVSFLFSYEFEECFFNIYASTKFKRDPVFFMY
jgi:hypothetical protein